MFRKLLTISVFQCLTCQEEVGGGFLGSKRINAFTNFQEIVSSTQLYQVISCIPSKMLSILRKARLKDKEMRILLLLVFYLLCWIYSSPNRRGLDAAGKTTICKKLLNENIDEVSPTLGFIIRTIEYDGLVASWMTFSRSSLVNLIQIQT